MDCSSVGGPVGSHTQLNAVDGTQHINLSSFCVLGHFAFEKN